jgi:signal recognition particle subunit SEC65
MPDHFYVYPAYLSKTGSRALGRRVPLPDAVPEATLEQITKAASSLGYKAEAEPGKQYPRQFYRYAGRVKVSKKPGVAKTQFLKELVRELRRQETPSGAG